MGLIYKWCSTFFYLTYISFKSKLVYNKRVVFQILQSVFSLYAFIFVWYALQGSGTVNRITLSGLVTYTVLSTLLSVCLPTDTVSKLFEQDIGSGNVSNKLLRPISMGSTSMAASLGSIAASLITKALPILVFSLVFKLLKLPQDPVIWIVFVFAVILGVLVTFLLDLATGYLCFWIFRGTHIRHFVEAVFTAFSGRLIPLSLLPGFFMYASYWTPGRLVYYDPISVFIGTMPKEQYGDLLIRFGVWIAVLYIVVHLLKKASLKRVFVQGG